MPVAGEGDGALELRARDPLREEVSWHAGIGGVPESHLAALEALLERKVAADEVTRAGRAAKAGADALVRQVGLVPAALAVGVAAERASAMMALRDSSGHGWASFAS